MVVAGGGGGGGSFASGPGNGGNGQLIAGFLNLPSTTATLKMTVGAGGGPGVVPGYGNPGGRGGFGGNGTGLYAYDAASNLLAVLAIAGGGGGGGGSDENYNVPGTGGNAGMNGAAGGYTGYWEAGFGSGAIGATFGAGAPIVASGVYSPVAGVDGVGGPSTPTTALQVGGRGAIYPTSSTALIDQRGGGGGGGWASGGGGGYATGNPGNMGDAGGGGGGSSWLNSLYFPNVAMGYPTSGPGLGGAGGTGSAEAGADGAVSFTLLLPVVGINPATGPLSGGTLVTITGNGFVPGSTSVAIGGQPCGFVVVSPYTSLTCVVPSNVTAGVPVDVVVTVSGHDYMLPAAYTYTNTTAPGLPTSVPPPLQMNLTLIGGDVATLEQNELGGLLRKAMASIANASGFPDVNVTIAGGAVSLLAANSSELLALTGAAINGSSFLVASAQPVGFQPVAPDVNAPTFPSASATATGSQTPSSTPSPIVCDLDFCALVNGQCYCRRRARVLRSSAATGNGRGMAQFSASPLPYGYGPFTGAFCAPIDLSVEQSWTVPVTDVVLIISYPLSFFTRLHASTDEQMARIMAVIQSLFAQALVGGGSGNEQLLAFAASWADCTGMPYTPAVIGEVEGAVLYAPPPPTPSVTATPEATTSPSQSSAASITPSSSISRSATPSISWTSTATASASFSASATATRSSSGTPGLVVPSLDLGITIVGGDEASLRAGAGNLLRQGIAAMTGVDGAFTTFTSIVTNYSTTPVGNIVGLVNATANATNINATLTVPGPAAVISPTDPGLNAPFRRRQLQSLPGSGCTAITLPSSGAVTVPVTTAGLNVQIPASFFIANGATSAADVAALIAQLQAQLLASLGNQSVVSATLGGFVTVWANCTGMPASSGVISDIGDPAAVDVPDVPVPVPDPSVGGGGRSTRIGVLAGVITGGVALMAVAALCMGVGGCSGIGAPASAHVCEVADVFRLAVAVRVPKASESAVAQPNNSDGESDSLVSRSPSAGGSGGGARTTPASAAAGEVVWVRTCPHMTLRSVALMAARAAGRPADTSTLATASLAVGGATFAIAEHGMTPLGELGVYAGHTAVLQF